MTTHPYWYRLAIDLDPAGNPIGISYEARMDDRIAAIHVLPLPGPFTDAHDELETLLTDLAQRYGIQAPLWTD